VYTPLALSIILTTSPSSNPPADTVKAKCPSVELKAFAASEYSSSVIYITSPARNLRNKTNDTSSPDDVDPLPSQPHIAAED